jgi:hypothetical protein
LVLVPTWSLSIQTYNGRQNDHKYTPRL